MGIFDRNRDGRTTLGEAARTFEQMDEYERAWSGDPHKDDGATCGGIVGGCLLVTVAPVASLALIFWVAWLVLG